MSLTTFIKRPEVRDRISEEFLNQGEGPSRPVQAVAQTENYPQIGAAFDYLLRFWLRRNVPECHARRWVAENSLKLAEDKPIADAEAIRKAVERAKVERDEFLETGTLTRDLIESALDLARVDRLYREGQQPGNFGGYEQGDIVDCINLVHVLESSGELEGEEVYLNPVFGQASRLVSGGDADVILDDTLIDVKVTVNSTFKQDYWRQLIGYLVLSDLHELFCEDGLYEEFEELFFVVPDKPKDIKEFGVYFARHGELETFPASLVYEAENYPEFRKWFVQTALGDEETDSPAERRIQELVRV